MRNLLEEIKKRVLIYDGSKGYMLQKFGLKGGECPESWNITHGDVVKKIYGLYKDAGSDVIQTNTFPGNGVYLERHNLRDKMYEINYHGARLAREVMGKDGFVAGDIGPTGKLFEPSGDLNFEEAYLVFKEQVKALEDGGVDVINFETFNDMAEMRAALLAAKENTNLPVIFCISFEQNGRTLMGTDPQTAVVILKTLGAGMIGTNCSFGPKPMLDIVKKMYETGGGYLCVKPNAGLPGIANDMPVYKETAEEFASTAVQFVQYGARLVGGCCGTTPEFIGALKRKLKNEVTNNNILTDEDFSMMIASATCTLNLNNCENIKIGKLLPSLGPGERSTVGDAARDFLRKIKEGNMELVADIALDLASERYDAVYINMAIDDEVDEDTGTLAGIVNLAQGYLRQPLIIKTSSPRALEKALRIYNGRAGVIPGKGKGSECHGCGDPGSGIGYNAIANNNAKAQAFKMAAEKYGALIIKPHIAEKILA